MPGLGGLSMRMPARRDWRLAAAADLGVFGSPNRPVRRRDARERVSRIVHCLRLAMMKRTMLATESDDQCVRMRLLAYGVLVDLLPKSATRMTTMMIAASPPLLMLNEAVSEPDAPAAVSTASPEPAPGA